MNCKARHGTEGPHDPITNRTEGKGSVSWSSGPTYHTAPVTFRPAPSWDSYLIGYYY